MITWYPNCDCTVEQKTKRVRVYENGFREAMNEEGPFVPLVQPGRVIVAATGIAAIDFNPTWSIDPAAVRG